MPCRVQAFLSSMIPSDLVDPHLVAITAFATFRFFRADALDRCYGSPTFLTPFNTSVRSLRSQNDNRVSAVRLGASCTDKASGTIFSDAGRALGAGLKLRVRTSCTQ